MRMYGASREQQPERQKCNNWHLLEIFPRCCTSSCSSILYISADCTANHETETVKLKTAYTDKEQTVKKNPTKQQNKQKTKPKKPNQTKKHKQTKNPTVNVKHFVYVQNSEGTVKAILSPFSSLRSKK